MQSDVGPATENDRFLWLEEMDSPRVRAWRDERNAETLDALCDAQFERDRDAVLAILNAPDRIPWVSRRGRFVYNFWRDDENPKGLWRRTRLENYRAEKPDWEIILDVDALAHAESEDWVWGGATALPPDFRRYLIRLSRGGSDAAVTREFDLEEKRFVPDGFDLPEAKGSAAWLDDDSLLVSSSLGGEPFQTLSGYSRTVRLWQRGRAFDEAPVLFECDRKDMAASGWRTHAPKRRHTLFLRQIDFFSQHLFVANAAGDLRRLDIPSDAYAGMR